MIVGLPGSVILRLALAWLTYTDARLWRPLRATLISALFPSPSLVTASPTVPEASDLSRAKPPSHEALPNLKSRAVAAGSAAALHTRRL